MKNCFILRYKALYFRTYENNISGDLVAFISIVEGGVSMFLQNIGTCLQNYTSSGAKKATVTVAVKRASNLYERNKIRYAEPAAKEVERKHIDVYLRALRKGKKKKKLEKRIR